MKEFFTFQNILAMILVLMAAYSVSATIKQKKALGKMVKPTFGGFRYTDKSQIVTFIICGILWGVLIATSPADTANLTFVAIFGASLLLFMFMALINVFMKPGFYENGVATGAGMIFFNGMKNYSIEERKKDPNTCYIFLRSSNGGFLSNTLRVIVNKSDLPEIKKILKKQGSFK